MKLSERACDAVGTVTNGWQRREYTARVREAKVRSDHLAIAAARGVEALVYLADIDERRFGKAWPRDEHANDSVDDGHVRWAVVGAITSLDQCMAAASWLGDFRSKQDGEHSVSGFYRVRDDGKASDKRDKVPAPWRGWLDSLVGDARFLPVARVRNCLTHGDAIRRITGTLGGTLLGHEMRFGFSIGPKAGSMLATPLEEVSSRLAIEHASGLACDHVLRFVELLENIGPTSGPGPMLT